jgi:hypothetical protein
MTLLSIRGLVIISVFTVLSAITQAQPLKSVAETKPYKILTSGKQISIKSTRDIKTVMVWTASGHRIVEQREINAASFSFNIDVNEKYFFVMIQYDGMKPFTEKIGI